MAKASAEAPDEMLVVGAILGSLDAFDELASRYRGRALVAKLDTDRAQSTAGGFQIRGIPTVIVFSGGAEVARQTGAVPLPALEALLKRALPDAA